MGCCTRSGVYIAECLHYNTVKLVQVKSWRLGLLHHSAQLVILAYILVYSIVLQHGYQIQAPLVGDISTKLKGNAYFHPDEQGSTIKIWDAVDVLYPPKEENAIFATTSFAHTRQQERTTCSSAEDEKYLYPNTGEKVSCDKNKKTCPAMMSTTNGITTGVCNGDEMCDIYSWCPIEGNVTTPLHGVGNMTLFVRSTVKFPKWQVMCGNYDGDSTEMGVNLFTLRDMVEETGYEMEDISDLGIVVGAFFRWECNFDSGSWIWADPSKCPKDCKPTIRFSRLDNPDSKLSQGYNFRWAYYYSGRNKSGQEAHLRDLVKVYGIRVVFVQSGIGWKFDLVTFLTQLGAGMGLMGVATILCDFVALYLWPTKDLVSNHKYEPCDTDEEKEQRERGYSQLSDGRSIRGVEIENFVENAGVSPSSNAHISDGI